MKKFIFFDLDGTLIFDDKELSNDTKDCLRTLDIKYGLCTNRPLSDIPTLDFLSNNKNYICEGGVVSYDYKKNKLNLNEKAKNINHKFIKKISLEFLKEKGLSINLRQNINRIYSSTLYFERPLESDTILSLGRMVTDFLGSNYEFEVLSETKMLFTIKNISKGQMIKNIMKENFEYYLISDDEKIEKDEKIENLVYISIDPNNSVFNESCDFVSSNDFNRRLIDVILYIKNKQI